jgi:surface protein
MDFTTEERYTLVRNLYMIRKQHGNRYGLLQPDFICIIFGSLMKNKYHRSNDDICEAVNAWSVDFVQAESTYGHISKWNTSKVTDMHELFKNKTNFVAGISNWDVSNVTDMSYMFNNCYNIIDTVDIISGWDVSSVTNMIGMFWGTDFDGDISRWNVSNVTKMYRMFKASFFNGDISRWNVGKVKHMNSMFDQTLSFNKDISLWNVNNVKNWENMFKDCRIFEQYKPRFNNI